MATLVSMKHPSIERYGGGCECGACHDFPTARSGGRKGATDLPCTAGSSELARVRRRYGAVLQPSLVAKLAKLQQHNVVAAKVRSANSPGCKICFEIAGPYFIFCSL